MQVRCQEAYNKRESHFFYAADALEFNLKSNNAGDVQIYRYPDQGHAFLNNDDWSIEKRKELGFVNKDIDPKTAEAKVRDLAWTRISQFFIQKLGGDNL